MTSGPVPVEVAPSRSSELLRGEMAPDLNMHVNVRVRKLWRALSVPPTVRLFLVTGSNSGR